MDLVSVIIPSYNRFKNLLNAIDSIKLQTYKNIEIIVVNDCSKDKEYYEYNWKENNINIIHLEKNSKELLGFACPQRNFGIKESKGKYIAFCDDDDIWFPSKIEIQINAMKETGCKMCCTDGLIGEGVYEKNKNYNMYNGEYFLHVLKNIYKSKGSNFLDNGFPKIWTLDFIKIHNCIITSSLIIDKDVVDKIGNFIVCNYTKVAEDYDYWLRALEHTNCVYIENICFYYDKSTSLRK
jgi:glycosyltransferase involved in cell wall biosynthesis